MDCMMSVTYARRKTRPGVPKLNAIKRRFRSLIEHQPVFSVVLVLFAVFILRIFRTVEKCIDGALSQSCVQHVP